MGSEFQLCKKGVWGRGMGVMPAQHHKCDVCFSSVAGNFVIKRMTLRITDINLYGRVAFRPL